MRLDYSQEGQVGASLPGDGHLGLLATVGVRDGRALRQALDVVDGQPVALVARRLACEWVTRLHHEALHVGVAGQRSDGHCGKTEGSVSGLMVTAGRQRDQLVV